MLNLFRESAKYPFNNISKVVILTVSILLFSIIIGIGVFIASLAIMGLMMEDISGLILAVPIGIIILLLAIIFMIFLYGYKYRIIKFAIIKSPLLPEFNEWKEMFLDGLKVFIVSIVYGIIFLIILGVINLIGSFIVEISPYNLQIIPAVIFGLIMIAIYLILSFLFLMGIPHMANNDGKLGKAFKFKEIYEVIKQIGLVKYITMAIILDVILLAVSFLFNIIPNFIFQTSPYPVMIILMMLISLIYVLIILPYLIFFENRVIGSIYAKKDEQNI